MKKYINIQIEESLRSEFKILAEKMSMQGEKITSQELMEKALKVGYEQLNN